MPSCICYSNPQNNASLTSCLSVCPFLHGTPPAPNTIQPEGMRVNKTVVTRTLDPEHKGQRESATEGVRAGWLRQGRVGGGWLRQGRVGGGWCNGCLPFSRQRECNERKSHLRISATKSQTRSQRPRSSCKVRGPWLRPQGTQNCVGGA